MLFKGSKIMVFLASSHLAVYGMQLADHLPVLVSFLVVLLSLVFLEAQRLPAASWMSYHWVMVDRAALVLLLKGSFVGFLTWQWQKILGGSFPAGM